MSSAFCQAPGMNHRKSAPWKKFSAYEIFVSRDPIGYEADPVNLYRFIQNGPLNAVDPYGLSPAGFPSGTPAGYDVSPGGADVGQQWPGGEIVCNAYPENSKCSCNSKDDSCKAKEREDTYPSRAKTICRQFVKMYNNSRAVVLAGICLVAKENQCNALKSCKARNQCRARAHYECYKEGDIFGDEVIRLLSGRNPVPPGGLGIGLGELVPSVLANDDGCEE